MKATVAVLDKHGDNSEDKIIDALKIFDVKDRLYSGLISAKKMISEKNLELLDEKKIGSSILVGYVSTKPQQDTNYKFIQLDDAVLFFEGRIYTSIAQKSVTELVSIDSQHCETLLQTIIQQYDGDYAFMLIKDDWIAVGRDPLGVQPLYYGENKDIATLATNRRLLWKLGIEEPLSFPPGNLAFVNREGFKFKPVKTLRYNEPMAITIADAAESLRTLVVEAIKRRLQGLNKVAVAFSGGLDSSLVAFLASKEGVKVSLIHVSLENQRETEQAIEAAEELDLPLQVYLFKESDVERALLKVTEIIEEPDPIKVSIGVPFYWAAEKIAEENYKVMLAGQGADELFGGYQRYVNIYCNEGENKVRKAMFNDVVNIHESNLERDLKICGHYDVELRLPFACFDVAEFALSLPVDVKIERKTDTLRKLVLRKMAFDAGVPFLIASKPKKAVQYSTGINDAIKRIAKNHDKTVKEYIAEIYRESRWVI
jgi:asparagine synthase (glutamine-hydrolysing)